MVQAYMVRVYMVQACMVQAYIGVRVDLAVECRGRQAHQGRLEPRHCGHLLQDSGSKSRA
jgi:hypothetical protein